MSTTQSLDKALVIEPGATLFPRINIPSLGNLSNRLGRIGLGVVFPLLLLYSLADRHRAPLAAATLLPEPAFVWETLVDMVTAANWPATSPSACNAWRGAS